MFTKPWTCTMTDALLDAAVMGELGPLQQRGFGRHRRECARCDATITDAARTVGALRSWPLESPSADFAARVLAARTEQATAPRMAWLRAAQTMVIWAVCLSVTVIAIAGVIWPGMREAPAAFGLEALGTLAHAARAAAVVGTATAGTLGVAAWFGVVVGFLVFYAAAFLGLRTFLLRRPT